MDYLRFPALGPIDKLRLAGTILYASRIEDGRPLERWPVAAWLIKLSGQRTFETIWRPLLKAKLGENYRQASAAFIWAIIRRLYAARRSGLKTELFGYVEGGYARVFEKFETALKQRGVRCLLNTPIVRIDGRDGQITVATASRDFTFDNVVVTVAAPIAARVCIALTSEEKNSLQRILYQGIICVSVLLTRPLRGAYLTYIADDEIPFTAVIEMSSLVQGAQFGGKSLVYLPRYLTVDDPLFEASDHEIEELFLAGLMRMYPFLAPTDILAVKISRVRQVLAVATLDYSKRLPPVQTSVPGLFILNSAHIVNGTLNVNETIKLADDMLPFLLRSADSRVGRAAVEPR